MNLKLKGFINEYKECSATLRELRILILNNYFTYYEYEIFMDKMIYLEFSSKQYTNWRLVWKFK